MKRLLVLGSAAAALLAVPALAQIDVRGPAATTRTDVQARTAERFARTDANRDGFLTQAEAQANAGRGDQGRGRGGERGEARQAKHFAELDRSGDGSISRAEFNAHHAARPDRAERQANRAERRADRIERRASQGIRFGARRFERVDSNRDGRVSLPEAQAVALARFAMMDANRDGQLTRDERRAARERMRAARGNG